ncbi:MAG: DUF1189 family protein [Candidatus Staskawiczbacteria bacterium]|jgi:hypothetical protein
MNIIEKIKDSIYGPKYYKEILEKPFSYSFKFLLVFALLFALVFTIVVTIKFIPLANMLAEKAPQLANYFPEELKVTIKDGIASTNVVEPYFIKMPEELKNEMAKSAIVNGVEPKTLENFIVIDTKNKFDLDTFSSYKTIAWLTADSVIYMDDNNKVSISSLSEVDNFYLDRGVIVNFINTLKPFIAVLYPIVFVGAYIVGFIIVMLEMIYLLIGALLIWLVAKIKGIKIGYQKAYQLGVHLIIPVIIITSILSLISSKLVSPFLIVDSILLIIFAWLNLNKIEAQAPAQTV